MNTTERKSKRRGGAIAALLLLSCLAGAAFAAPIPNTTDHRNATTPMITGSAMLVNEHQLLVETEQGEEVLLSLDSRTMVPADLAQGMMMRVEFKYLEDGSRLAERVIPIREGQKTTRELAYSNERENDEEMAHYASTNQPEERSETHASHAASATNQPLGTPLRPVPNTEAYKIATEPMLAGEVEMVNDHKLVVATDQGHTVPVEMDSRTLIPSDLQSGMGVRVEYKTLENGTKLATRIVPLRDYEANEREMATSGSEENEENEAMPANNVEMSSTTSANESGQNEQAEVAGSETAATEAKEEKNESGTRELPKTASNQPLVVLLGLAALATAGALAARRRLRVG